MLQADQLHGVIVPLVAPFRADGELDLSSYERYLERLLRHSIQGIVLNGTTGEAPTVEWTEVEAMFQVARSVIGRLGLPTPIIVGTGTNDTRTTARRTEQAGRWGADAALVVTPYYSRPSEDGVYRHFRAAADTGVPIVAYEVPSRTGIRLSADAMANVLELGGVIGLKDATGNFELSDALAPLTSKPVLAGSDDLFAPMLRRGATGGFLASANVRTETFLETYRLAAEGRYDEAEAVFDRVLPLVRLLFQASNPTPLKWLLARAGLLASDTLRLPLTLIGEELQDALSEIMSREQ